MWVQWKLRIEYQHKFNRFNTLITVCRCIYCTHVCMYVYEYTHTYIVRTRVRNKKEKKKEIEQLDLC